MTLNAMELKLILRMRWYNFLMEILMDSQFLISTLTYILTRFEVPTIDGIPCPGVFSTEFLI